MLNPGVENSIKTKNGPSASTKPLSAGGRHNTNGKELLPDDRFGQVSSENAVAAVVRGALHS